MFVSKGVERKSTCRLQVCCPSVRNAVCASADEFVSVRIKERDFANFDLLKGHKDKKEIGFKDRFNDLLQVEVSTGTKIGTQCLHPPSSPSGAARRARGSAAS